MDKWTERYHLDRGLAGRRRLFRAIGFHLLPNTQVYRWKLYPLIWYRVTHAERSSVGKQTNGRIMPIGEADVFASILRLVEHLFNLLYRSTRSRSMQSHCPSFSTWAVLER